MPGIDPPAAGEFGKAVAAARLVREALSGAGLAGAVKTSGAKGVHVYVPVQGLPGPGHRVLRSRYVGTPFRVG